jgi:hypothetical protein
MPILCGSGMKTSHTKDMHRDNHYVPRSYLKRWTLDGLKVSTYQLLVGHAQIPAWRERSTRGIAYHEHLYTKLAASGESDEIERWLDSEFEAPAEESIDKVVRGQRLTSLDWKRLVRFFAAQDVRTPARLIENLKRWSNTVPDLVQTTLTESVARLEAMPRVDRTAFAGKKPPHDGFPTRVTVDRNTDGPNGQLTAEVVLGRGLWLWSMQHLLARTLSVLHHHRWTILVPPDGLTWFTSDDPVLKLNFNSDTNYTFGGGWGSVGTDLLLPLGPHHLLYTQVGKSVPRRGTRLDLETATVVRKLIAEHAHRFVFSSVRDPFVEQVRPRIVDVRALRQEADEWKRWHVEQSSAEQTLASDHARQSPATPQPHPR